MSPLDTLIKKLAGASSSVAGSVEAQPSPVAETAAEVMITDAVYVEKLASAVDFIVDNWNDEEPEPTALQTTEISEPAEEVKAVAETETAGVKVAEISGFLRTKLESKLSQKDADKAEAAKESKAKLASALLDKIHHLRSEAGEPEVTDEKEDFEDEVAKALSVDDLNLSEKIAEPVNADSNEEEVKAASVNDQTLADVLNAALNNGSIEPNNESAPEQSTKTAGVRGGKGSSARKEATQRLKNKLMAKVGEEA
jgi:hypothetical protein